MPSTPMFVDEVRPQVRRFYLFLAGAGLLAAALTGLALAFPAAWIGKKLWTAGSFLVFTATVERLYFDIKRLANTHNRTIDPDVFTAFAFTLRLELFVGRFWILGTILLYLDHWFPRA